MLVFLIAHIKFVVSFQLCLPNGFIITSNVILMRVSFFNVTPKNVPAIEVYKAPYKPRHSKNNYKKIGINYPIRKLYRTLVGIHCIFGIHRAS